MKKQIMVSRPASGLMLYLCKEVTNLLGGVGAKVVVKAIEPLASGGIQVAIAKAEKSKGLFPRGHRLSSPDKDDRRYFSRFMVSSDNLTLAKKDIYGFGPTHLDWFFDVGKDTVTFTIPPKDQLNPPIKKGPRSYNKKTPAVVESHIDRVGRVVREMNELLAAIPAEDENAPDDALAFQIIVGGDGGKPINLSSDCRVRAIRTVTQVFG